MDDLADMDIECAVNASNFHTVLASIKDKEVELELKKGILFLKSENTSAEFGTFASMENILVNITNKTRIKLSLKRVFSIFTRVYQRE